MVKRILKVVMVIIMILGFVFSLSNFFYKTTEAVMIDQLLDFHYIQGGYIYKCLDGGNGCHTVIPDPEPN